MHIVGSLGLLASPYIKLSGSLIVHETPSKFAPNEYKFCFQKITFQIAKNITKLGLFFAIVAFQA